MGKRRAAHRSPPPGQHAASTTGARNPDTSGDRDAPPGGPAAGRWPGVLDLFVALFAGSAVLGTLVAYDPWLSAPALGALLASVALYFAVARLARSVGGLRLLATGALVAGTTFSLYLIVQYGHLGYTKGGPIVWLGRATTVLPDLHGFVPQPNAAAAFMEVGLPLGLALELSGRGPAARAFPALCAAVLGYAVLLTASRGAWSALGVVGAGAVGAVVLRRRLPRQRAILVGGGAVAAGLALITTAAVGPSDLPFLASTLERASDRTTLYHNSLYLASDYAFSGIGLAGTFGMVYSRYSLLIFVPFLMYVHNLPLSVWLGQGAVGLVAFVGMVAALYLMVSRTVRRGRPPILFHGAWLGATVALLHGLADAPQYSPDGIWVMPVLFVALGLAAGCARRTPELVRPAARVCRWPIPLPAALGLAAVVLAVAAVVSYRPVAAAWTTNLGALAETRGELSPGLSDEQREELCRTAEADYRAALAIDPGLSNAERRLGNLLVGQERFDEAVPLLEAALASEPDSPAALKGLGLAYVWVGSTEEAARLLRRVSYPSEMDGELSWWSWYRLQRGQPELSAFARETRALIYPGR